MKKVIVLIMVLSFMFSFAACVGTDSNEEKTTIGFPVFTTAEGTTEDATTEAATEEAFSGKAEENTTAAAAESEMLPVDENGMGFLFQSGAGGWRTELMLYSDGSFNGEYSDSELGSSDINYPNGTVYICSFDGKFSDIKKINNYTYSMTLSEITLKYDSGEEWIEDGVRYVASGPYGIEGGKDFVFYLPDAPISEFNEDFLLWWPMKYEHSESPFETLSCYAIRNTATEEGFFSY